ncbi:MAG: glycosyl hydrolase family 79 C-terminal domain-containing protein [Candidatus Dormibacteria bacterium]
MIQRQRHPHLRDASGSILLVAAILLVLAVARVQANVSRPERPTAPAAQRAALGRTPVTVATPPGPPQAVVTLAAPSRPALGVPGSFLGLSTEYWTVPVWARHLSLLGHVLASISSNGPIVLRIGGSSADQTFFASAKEPPEWVFETSPAWLRQVRRIVTRFGVRVNLDLNMVTATPQIAVRWARAAQAALPIGSVIGFEIGNEGDIYSHTAWQELTGGTIAARALPQTMTAPGYAASYRVYAAALAEVAHGVPLLGPALSDPAAHPSWVSQLLAGPHPGLGAITVHRYPLSACALPGSKMFPTIARVLSEPATAGMATSLRSSVRAARGAGLPLRLTEINSVTCGGRRGVSNTFATALWAPDALFELLHAGAASAAVHVRANAINMAFSLTRDGLVAHPLLYGMAMFSRTIGPGAHLVGLHLKIHRGLRLKAWAVRLPGNRIHVLLINKGAAGARVSLRIPAQGSTMAQALLAPSVRATSGVTLGGQHLSRRGVWTGAPVGTRLRLGPGGGYRVVVRGYSATLVTARLRSAR